MALTYFGIGNRSKNVGETKRSIGNPSLPKPYKGRSVPPDQKRPKKILIIISLNQVSLSDLFRMKFENIKYF